MSNYKLYEVSRGLGNRRGLKIGHINAQSLRADGDKRDSYKSMFQSRLEHRFIKAQNNFDIFGITETWFIDNDTTHSDTTDNDTTDNDTWIIDGYHEPEVECRTVSVGRGGVAVYVRENIKYKPINKGSYSYDEEFVDCMGDEDEHPIQDIHIKVTSKDDTPITHIHVVVIYIPPNATKKQHALIGSLRNKMHDYNNVVVLGDVNVDAYTSSSKHNEKIEKSKFGQIINFVTRPASGTLIDHIYVKAFPLPNQATIADRVATIVKPYIAESGVMLTNNHVGDHDLIFCVIDSDYYGENLSDPRQAYSTFLKSMGVHEDVGISDIYNLAQRLARYFIQKESSEGIDVTETLCEGLSISARIVHGVLQ